MAKKTADERLTPQQALFVAEYVKDSNGTRAAIAAGYAEKNARAQASRLLTQANIQRAVDELVQAASARTLITLDRVLRELGRIAFVDPQALQDEEGNIKPLREMPEDVRHAVASIEEEEKFERGEDGEFHRVFKRKVKLWDKRAALNDLRDHLAPVRRVEVTGKDGEPLPAVAAPVLALDKLTDKQLLALIEATKA